MDVPTKTRFAPSPTGPLHIGGARTALFNYLFAKSTGGEFIVRIDDTDPERSKPEYVTEILKSLEWLGLEWDDIHYQSKRKSIHKAYAKLLAVSGNSYMGDEGVIRIRYTVPCLEEVNDLVLKQVTFDMSKLGTPVAIMRSDLTPTYHLASVVDDINLGITHVIRGQDHFTNTPKHQLIYKAFSEKLPQFAHIPLILTKEGKKMSKRNSKPGDLLSVNDFKDAGYSPEALINFLALMGWSHPQEKETLSMKDLVDNFTLERVNKAPAKFFTTKLDYLNKWWKKNNG